MKLLAGCCVIVIIVIAVLLYRYNPVEELPDQPVITSDTTSVYNVKHDSTIGTRKRDLIFDLPQNYAY